MFRFIFESRNSLNQKQNHAMADLKRIEKRIKAEKNRIIKAYEKAKKQADKSYAKARKWEVTAVRMRAEANERLAKMKVAAAKPPRRRYRN